MRVLVTGGTGALGRLVVPRLLDAEHEVRVMSRRSDPNVHPGVEAVQANLRGTDGFEAAVAGVHAVIHLATSFSSQRADIEGTRRLLAAAEDQRVKSFVFPSIVGIDRSPMSGYGYYAGKLAAERVVESSDLPWTVVRFTQFHTLALRFLMAMDRLPWLTVLRGVRFQLVDPGDAADQIVAALARPGPRHLPDVAGPREETMQDIARAYQRHRGSRKPVLAVPIDVGFGRGFVAGQNLASPDRMVGTVTWEDFLTRTFAAP